jgi:general secretion pathway protein C
MKHLFKSQALKRLWSLVLIVLAIKILWFLVEIVWLPSTGVEQSEARAPKALYYRVKLGPNEAVAPSDNQEPVQRAGSIKDISLLAIYNASDATVVTVEHQNKTKVLAKGESINGFVLEGAGSNYATFSKNAKIYQLDLFINTKGNGSIRNATPSASAGDAVQNVQGEVVDAGDHKLVDRSLVEHYSKNMADLEKNIGIKEIKQGNKLTGFSISFIRKGSLFEKLGVQRGDVIKTINGQQIDSYNAAMDIYKNISDMDNMTLVIQRGKEEMELEYEVN